MIATGKKGDRFTNRGEISAYDFDENNIIADDTYHDLDLSSIVPKGNIPILIQFSISYQSGNKYLKIRKKGFTTDYEAFVVRNSGDNYDARGIFIVECNADRIIECNLSPATNKWVGLIVGGWWI